MPDLRRCVGKHAALFFRLATSMNTVPMNNVLHTKTDAGRAALGERGRSLAPAERQVLILCDGERDIEDLLELLPEETLTPALVHLTTRGLIVAQPAPRKVRLKPVELSEAQRYRLIAGRPGRTRPFALA